MHFSGGIQFATAQLPLLELVDCGMTICDPNSSSSEENDGKSQKMLNAKLHLIYQKLIIKHSRLKKLSLWGCSGLDVSIPDFSNHVFMVNFIFLESYVVDLNAGSKFKLSTTQ